VPRPHHIGGEDRPFRLAELFGTLTCGFLAFIGLLALAALLVVGWPVLLLFLGGVLVAVILQALGGLLAGIIAPAVGLALGAVFAVAYGLVVAYYFVHWLKGLCPPSGLVAALLLIVPFLLANTLTSGRFRGPLTLLWLFAAPLVFVFGNDCEPTLFADLRDAMRTTTPHDADAELAARASVERRAERRTSVSGALGAIDRNQSVCGRPIHISDDILFEADRDRLRPDAIPLLDQLAQVLRRSPYAQVTIEGHADQLGDPLYNEDLSKRRARAVAEWLVANAGIPAERIKVIGLGATHPLFDERGRESFRRLNRRVEVHVVCPAARE
jgi:outer membrane protein OmpA-like peptidoglycan-associated protein